MEERGTMRRAVMTLDEAKRIFKEYHASGMGGHFGRTKSTTSITRDFKWKNMTNHIKHWVSKTLPGYTHLSLMGKQSYFRSFLVK